MGSGSTEKSRSGGLLTKTTNEKFKNVSITGSKKNYSNTSSAKATTSSYGDKKSTPLSTVKNNSASSSGKYKTSNIEVKTNLYSGKSATAADKAGSSKSKITNSIPPQATDKNYLYPSNANSKSKKSSMTFGIIWLPTKRRNKLKDAVYNPYDNDKRDRSKERSPSMYNFTSGDTSNQVYAKKQEESHLLAPNKLMPVPAVAMTSNDLPVEIAYADNTSEQQEFITRNTDDMKDVDDDTFLKNDHKDYLENKESLNKAPDAINDKQEDGDKVGGGMLNNPSPPDKVWKSNASIIEDEDCDITCLYYTLQCCDCVIS